MKLNKNSTQSCFDKLHKIEISTLTTACWDDLQNVCISKNVNTENVLSNKSIIYDFL